MTIRLFGGLIHLRGIIKRHARPLSEAWQTRVDEIKARLGIRGEVQIFGSVRVDVPMVVGFFKPVVLVPMSALTSLPRSYLEAILAHELAHVLRHDYLVNILQSVVEIALFYHPAVHWVSRRIRVERENACDDIALTIVGDKLLYARALTELEASRAHPSELALASNGGSLMLRIKRLIETDPQKRSSLRTFLVPALVLSGALGLTLASLSSCVASTDEEKAAEESSSVEAKSAEAKADLDIQWLPPALTRWKSVIVSTAERVGVDPDALAIVMLVESGGNPQAESSGGAVGLMQLMPKTAETIAKEQQLPAFSTDRLKEPELNVDLGARFFAQQMASFGKEGDANRTIELSAAAYNGGPKVVQAYLDGKAELSEETKNYKALVAGMWKERNDTRSATYDAWRERVRTRAAKKASSPLADARVTHPFGKGTHPFSGKEYFHRGIDLGKEPGAAIVAPLDGTVEKAALEGDLGNVVVLKHKNGLETHFYHLGDIAVKPGQAISKGATIGSVGATGKVTGPHLHYEVLDNGEPIDPTPYVTSDKPAP